MRCIDTLVDRFVSEISALSFSGAVFHMFRYQELSQISTSGHGHAPVGLSLCMCLYVFYTWTIHIILCSIIVLQRSPAIITLSFYSFISGNIFRQETPNSVGRNMKKRHWHTRLKSASSLGEELCRRSCARSPWQVLCWSCCARSFLKAIWTRCL